MRHPLFLLTLMGCAARVDPLADRRARLDLAAVEAVPRNPGRDPAVSVAVSAPVLARFARAAADTGVDGALQFDTPIGAATLEIHPTSDGSPIVLDIGDCARCFSVQGQMRGDLAATLSNGATVRARGGLAVHAPVRVDVEERGAGTDLWLTADLSGERALEVGLVGLPLGGFGINAGLQQGIHAALHDRPIPVAYLPADGLVPIRDVWPSGPGVFTASLRVLDATPPPAAPALGDGLWVGAGTGAMLGWAEAWALRHPMKRWSPRPAALRFEGSRGVLDLEVWRHRRKPKLRTYRISGEIRSARGRITVSEPRVEALDVGRGDFVGAIIRKKVLQYIETAGARGMAASGDLHIRERTLRWTLDDLSLGADTVEGWFRIEEPDRH
jgi:hypothetical protein